MKKLNEIVPNELLHELKNQYEFDMINDCVQVTFYRNHKTDSSMIGKFYSMDAMGECILERYTVKSFSINVMQSKTFNNMGVDIDIVLNV